MQRAGIAIRGSASIGLSMLQFGLTKQLKPPSLFDDRP
jgi:hypothetical protein